MGLSALLKNCDRQLTELEQKSPKTQKIRINEFRPNQGGQSEFLELLGPDFPCEPLPMKALLLRGGVGSGKSTAGAYFVVRCALGDPSATGLITACDFGQLEKSTLVPLVRLCEEFGIPIRPHLDDPEETARAIAARRSCKIGQAHVHVLSASKFASVANGKTPSSGRGISVRWIWGDELAFTDSSVFETLLSRVGRGPGSMKGVIVITTTPNRSNAYNWVFKTFDDPSRDSSKALLFQSLVLDTRDNASLDDDFITTLEASLTPELLTIDVRGGYEVVAVGAAFKYFSRQNNGLTTQDGITYDPAATAILGFDFNIQYGSCTLAQWWGGDLVFIKEFREDDTFALAAAVFQFLAASCHTGRIEVHGDCSGSNRSANSRLSNWDVVWQACDRHKLKQQSSRKYGSSNPSVFDSVMLANSFLRSQRVMVLTDTCPLLAQDLEQTRWRGGQSTELDKSQPELTHMADAARYAIYGSRKKLSGDRDNLADLLLYGRNQRPIPGLRG